jgi:hypothetical protein
VVDLDEIDLNPVDFFCQSIEKLSASRSHLNDSVNPLTALEMSTASIFRAVSRKPLTEVHQGRKERAGNRRRGRGMEGEVGI